MRRARRPIALGPQFNEAARQLSLALMSRGWNPNDLGRHLAWVLEQRASNRLADSLDIGLRGPGAKAAPLNPRSLGALVRRWVRGKTTPERDFAALLQDELGIACAAWREKPRVPFSPEPFPRQRRRGVATTKGAAPRRPPATAKQRTSRQGDQGR